MLKIIFSFYEKNVKEDIFTNIFKKSSNFVKLIQLDLDPDLATQVNADPDPKP